MQVRLAELGALGDRPVQVAEPDTLSRERGVEVGDHHLGVPLDLKTGALADLAGGGGGIFSGTWSRFSARPPSTNGRRSNPKPSRSVYRHSSVSCDGTGSAWKASNACARIASA